MKIEFLWREETHCEGMYYYWFRVDGLFFGFVNYPKDYESLITTDYKKYRDPKLLQTLRARVVELEKDYANRTE